jgi:uncharacterized protein
LWASTTNISGYDFRKGQGGGGGVSIEHTEPAAGDGTRTTPPCVPWGFWGTALWGAFAIAGWFAAQIGIGFGLMAWYGLGLSPSETEIEEAISLAWLVALTTSLSAPVPIAIVALAVRFARCPLGEYLAFIWPRGREFLIGSLTLAIVLPLGDLLSHLTGQRVSPEFVTGLYESARDADALPLLALAVVAAAPLAEEILFRGFLLPGFAARIGGVTAVLMTAAAWALMHLQYELFYIWQVFVLGVAFGWLRLRSGSTLLVIVLHALVNLLALVQVGLIVERMT